MEENICGLIRVLCSLFYGATDKIKTVTCSRIMDDLIKTAILHIKITSHEPQRSNELTQYVIRERIKSKDKIRLTVLIKVTVSNFTYNFST